MLEYAVGNPIVSAAGRPINALVHIHRMLAQGVRLHVEPSVVMDVAAQDLNVANIAHVQSRVIIVVSNFHMVQDDVVTLVQPDLGRPLSLYSTGIGP
jgi:hypothetical protein